jgi:hypothetical protein
VKSSRALVLAAAAVVAVCAPHAQAAPASKPQVVDPAGDALAPGGFDIVSGQFATTGVTTTRKVGKRVVRSYTPKNLVVTLTFTEPPSTQTGTRIAFTADITACDNGSLAFSYTPGAVLQSGDLFVTGCGTDDGVGPAEFMPDVHAVIKGSTVTWTMPLSDMGSDLPLGTQFSAFTASVDLVDPVFGLIGTDITGGPTSLDVATGDATWKLG